MSIVIICHNAIYQLTLLIQVLFKSSNTVHQPSPYTRLLFSTKQLQFK